LDSGFGSSLYWDCGHGLNCDLVSCAFLRQFGEAEDLSGHLRQGLVHHHLCGPMFALATVAATPVRVQLLHHVAYLVQ
jgi:hypothetical protein